MTSEPPQNPFFRPPRESTLGDEEVRRHVRAEFYDIRSRFLNRLACARVFDRERFEALLLWLDTLRRCYAAADLPMAASDFDQFSDIAGYLEQEATYSRDQRAECAAANPAIASLLQSWRPVGRVAELGSLGCIEHYAQIPIPLHLRALFWHRHHGS